MWATAEKMDKLRAHLRMAELSGQPAALTGHLIGAELTAARAYWLGQQVVCVGAPVLATALASQGVPCDVADPDDLTAKALNALS